VCSRLVERLRPLFVRLQGLLGRNAKDVWLDGLKTQRSNEVYDLLPPRS
jgi:hypothetical protein